MAVYTYRSPGQYYGQFWRFLLEPTEKPQYYDMYQPGLLTEDGGALIVEYGFQY